MDKIMEYLPFILPIFILELILMLTALIHLLRHPNYKFGNKILWIIIVCAFQIVGPIIYFALGKGED